MNSKCPETNIPTNAENHGSNNSLQSDDYEKPLSPVLCNTTINRKYIYGKRLHNKKTRVKLSNRFETAKTNTSTKVSDLAFLNTDLTEINNETSLSNLQNIPLNVEECASNVMASCNKFKENEFCFKKPISPAPHNKTHNIQEGIMNTSNFHSRLNEGFKTASGKIINISDSDLKYHSKLFEDCLNQSCDSTIRNKKYSFLKKSNNSNDFGIKIVSKSLSGSEKTANKCNSNLASVKEDCELEETENIEQKNEFKSSFTQEISDFGISNTQMCHAIDKVLDNIKKEEIRKTNIHIKAYENEFKGFNEEDYSISKNKSLRVYQLVKNIISNIQNSTTSNKYDGNKKCLMRKSIFSISKGNKEIDMSLERKHQLDEVLCPPEKRKKAYNVTDQNDTKLYNDEINYFIDKDLLSNFTPGFKTAGGKNIEIDNQKLKNAIKIYENIPDDYEDESFSETKPPNKHCNSTKKEVMHSRNTSTKCINNRSVEEKVIKSSRIPKFIGDNYSKKISKQLHNDDYNKIELSNQNIPFTVGFTTAGGSDIKIQEEHLEKAKSMYESIKESNLDIETPIPRWGGSDTSNASNKKEAINRTTNKGAGIFADLFSEEELKAIQSSSINAAKFRKCTGSFKNVSSEEKIKNKSHLKTTFMSAEENLASINEPENQISNFDKYSTIPSFSLSKSKKRLGVSSCKQINVSNNSLEKAKLLFQEENVPSPRKFCSTPTKVHNNSITATSTPIRYSSSNTLIKETFVKTNYPSVTPIKPVINISNVSEDDSTIISESCKILLEDCKIYTDSPILIQKQTSGEIGDWLENLQHEQKLLEKKISIIKEKQAALIEQEQLLKQPSIIHSKQRKGILFKKKTSGIKIPLKEYVQNKLPLLDNSTTLTRIDEVHPQNAEYIHFNFVNHGESIIKTLDEALLIPNSKNLIGLTEIENAFKTMPGVETRLLPKSWIRNHYKWIIWKLASYERAFPQEFDEAFCIENVIQQLKYRYDREIDRAERSSLHKIYETDDTPKKRLVLCVSNIIQTKNNEYEIELTDGWYCIRTIIDGPLCQQIISGRIEIGTKLLIFGAELLNSEGCHPLDANDLIKLKISINSTRRASWYAKLGYQKLPGPFTIPLYSIHPNGGIIGCLKLFIARIYPIKYMEKQDGVTVWRNKRADERRAQEWENERSKTFEKVREDVYKEYEKNNVPTKNKLASTDIRNIGKTTCPEILYELIQNSKDPDSIENALTSSQKTAVYNYKQNISLKKMDSINQKINEQISRLRHSQRDVSSVLKLVVIDVYKEISEKGVNFHIWNPTENHLQMLKEGCTFNIYNILPKSNGDLTSSKSTKFEVITTSRICLDKFKRQILPIVLTQKNICKPFLNEFDTVGIIVQTTICSNTQELWLSDFFGKMLYVKILEGSNRCLLYDNLKRGQIISCCNLVLCAPHEKFGQAVANQHSVVTSYPQHSHLKEGIEEFKQELPKDLDNFLNDCDNKIKYFNEKNISTDVNYSGSPFFDDSIEESTFNQTKLTSTDVALSLIDIDQFQ